MINLHNKLTGEVPTVYNGIGIGTAIAVSAAGSLYTANKQQGAMEEAQDYERQLAEEARVNEQKIFAEQARQSNDEATIQFGIEDDDEFGSFNDFLSPVGGSSNGSFTGLGLI